MRIPTKGTVKGAVEDCHKTSVPFKRLLQALRGKKAYTKATLYLEATLSTGVATFSPSYI